MDSMAPCVWILVFRILIVKSVSAKEATSLITVGCVAQKQWIEFEVHAGAVVSFPVTDLFVVSMKALSKPPAQICRVCVFHAVLQKEFNQAAHLLQQMPSMTFTSVSGLFPAIRSLNKVITYVFQNMFANCRVSTECYSKRLLW